MRLDDEVILLIDLYKKCERLCSNENLTSTKTILSMMEGEAELLVRAEKVSKKALDTVKTIYGYVPPKPSYVNERSRGGC